MRSWIICSLLLSSLGLAVNNSYAANDTPMYQVEMLIFEQPPSLKARHEQWPNYPALPELETAVNLSDESAESLVELPSSEYKLSGIEAKLARDGYTIRWHRAWRQAAHWPGKLKIETPNVLLGSIELLTSNNLQLSTDLLFYLNKKTNPISWRAKRRMKLGELHYLDHPQLGILVKVIPFQVSHG